MARFKGNFATASEKKSTMINNIKIISLAINILPLLAWSQDITWANFKGKPPAGEPTVLARTVTTMEMTTTEIDKKFYFEVKGGMSTFLSWTRTRDPKVLKHEKTHRLIAIIFAKLCQSEIDSLWLDGKDSTARPRAQASFDKWYKEMSAAQDEFDLESSHGSQPQMEVLWESLVADKLKELK